MEDAPLKDRNQEIETISSRHLRNYIPTKWVLNEFQKDYGTDFHVEIAPGGMVQGDYFSIQLKGKEKDNGNSHVTIKKIKRRTINRWLRRLEPTLIVGYLVNEKKAYWGWITEKSFDLSKPNKEFQIKLPKTNSYEKINWEEIAKYVNQIFNRRHLLYQSPSPKTDKESEAWELYLSGQHRKALPQLYELAAKNEGNALLLNAIAMCEYDSFNYKQALLNINKAFQIEQNDVIKLNKGSILAEYGNEKSDLGMINSSLDIFKELMDSELDKAKVYFNYANSLIYLQDYENAIPHFEESLKYDPNMPDTWKNLGSAYYQIGDHEKEVDSYHRALNINPNHPQALFSLGITKYKVFNEIQKGVDLMVKAISTNESFTLGFQMAYFWISEAYLELRNLEDSKKWNKVGLENNPSNEYFVNQKMRIETLEK